MVACREGQYGLARELRFVGEDRGDDVSEGFGKPPAVALVGHLDKAGDRRRIQGVQVGLVIEPRVLERRFEIGVAEQLVRGARFVLFQTAVGAKLALFVQFDGVAGEQFSVAGSCRRGGRIRKTLAALVLPIGGFGEKEGALAVTLVLGDDAARRAGGPAVLVVEPGEHPLFFGLVDARRDQVEELVGEIRRLKPRADVHMRAAEAHLFHHVDLPEQLVFFQTAVPRPEGGAAVLARRVTEQFGRERFLPILLIEHLPLPSGVIHRTRSA